MKAAALVLALAAALPVPREPQQVFYVQRSLNANTIVYAARITGGALDSREPVEVYWRRYGDAGERKPLSGLERSLAFGVKAEPAKGRPGSFLVRVVSYPSRPALLRLVEGVPRLEARVAGEPAVLDHAWLEVDDSGRLPSVTRVDLYGTSLATGKPLKESFIP